MRFENISEEILDFVDRYIEQFVCWDILVYFHENQDLERKLSLIALDIGRRTSAVEGCLEGFVEEGILEREEEEAEEPSYRYVAQAGFKQRMDEFMLATRDRTVRLAIVSKVLQKEAGRL